MKSHLVLAAVSAAAILVSVGQVRASDYFNGFENPTDVNDFAPSSHITRVPSGGGTLGLTASSGSYYAEITNIPDDYQAGVGDSTYTFYGSGVVAPQGFSESVDYYIDASHWSPTSPAYNSGFWIDSTPSNDPAYIDELNFRLSMTAAGTVDVATGTIASGQTPLTSITSSGWYTFTMTFDPGASGFVTNTMSVSDHGGTVLASFTNQSTLSNAALTGTNYGDWTTVWGNGFANNTLAIDNVSVTANAVPLPSALGMGAILLGALGAGTVIRRKYRVA